MTPLFATKQSPDKAFERLYQAHVHDVYRYALMVLRNPADAEDVAQTTFMNAYRAIQRGEKPRAPRHWLIAIAHNVCRTRLRDASRRPQQVELEDYHVATEAETEAEGIDAQELVKALGVLSFNQRSALVMRELEGRSYAEIAELLEVSPTAVETLIFRARRALREQLEGSLSCGEAELALSKQLDGRLDADGKRRLRAHLRECKECAGLARRERARSAALRSLGFPLPASLTSWGGGAAVGTGIAVKAAAVVAASVAAAGVAHQAAEAVSTPASHEPAIVETAGTTRAPSPLVSSFRAGPRSATETRASAATKRKARRHAEPGTAPVAPASARTGGAGAAGSASDSGSAPSTPLPAVTVPQLPTAVPPPPKLPVDPPPLPPVTTPELPPLPALPPVQPPPVPTTPEVPQLP
jgi:RNA polymerase sigma factor (sigma-70 family)